MLPIERSYLLAGGQRVMLQRSLQSSRNLRERLSLLLFPPMGSDASLWQRWCWRHIQEIGPLLQSARIECILQLYGRYSVKRIDDIASTEFWWSSSLLRLVWYRSMPGVVSFSVTIQE